MDAKEVLLLHIFKQVVDITVDRIDRGHISTSDATEQLADIFKHSLPAIKEEINRLPINNTLKEWIVTIEQYLERNQ